VPVEHDWPDRLAAFPITVDANSARDGLLLALRSTAPGGLCTSTGMHFGLTKLPLYDLYLQNITLKLGLIQARAEMPAVLDAIATGTLDPAPVVDRVLDCEDAIAALPDVRE
jgi:threonine dehydrogenase-like Zn-dependent dehydrogenase